MPHQCPICQAPTEPCLHGESGGQTIHVCPAGHESLGPPGCVHHWRIGPQEGPTSDGVCKKCGEGRVFQNSLTVSDWDYLPPRPRPDLEPSPVNDTSSWGWRR